MPLSEGNYFPLAQDQATFNEQADHFLTTYNFPVDDNFRRLYAVLVQHLGENQAGFNGDEMANKIRRHRANEFAFNLMRECNERAKLRLVPAGESNAEATEGTVAAVEPKA